DAGGPRLGVRQAGAAERAAGGARHFQARLQERADPGAHAGRDQPRHHGQRGGCRGDGLRLAGRRPTALRGHRLPRLPGGSAYSPALGALAARFRRPARQAAGSENYLLGTDHLGRDVLSRLIFGARVSMIVGFTAVIVAGFIGTVLGIISGYLGRWVDQVIMRLTDTWLALPALTFAIFLAAIVGPSEFNIIVILGAVYWTRYARVIRGEVLSVKERDFVRLAVVAGCSKWTIMRVHILPNVINSAIVLGTLQLGVVIITEAALSFLGVGGPPPQPAWGLMLAA